MYIHTYMCIYIYNTYLDLRAGTFSGTPAEASLCCSFSCHQLISAAIFIWGFHKQGYPQPSSLSRWMFHYKSSILGYHHLWNPQMKISTVVLGCTPSSALTWRKKPIAFSTTFLCQTAPDSIQNHQNLEPWTALHSFTICSGQFCGNFYSPEYVWNLR